MTLQLRYNAMILRDTDLVLSQQPVDHISADNPQALADMLKSYIGTYTQVFPYYGIKWDIGATTNAKYLISPDGQKIQIPEKEEDEIRIDSSGSMLIGKAK